MQGIKQLVYAANIPTLISTDLHRTVARDYNILNSRRHAPALCSACSILQCRIWNGLLSVNAQEVQGASIAAAEPASMSSQEDVSEPEAAAAGVSQQGMAQSKDRAQASLTEAAQYRKQRLKALMAEQELAFNLGSATGTRCLALMKDACSASLWWAG